ncbi:MAG: peptide chain release factor aRF-1 [Candidatus Diapherotrites archaeon]|nr:peptide chain release factor aRF-1 [Candidatus Diapherotrites archaeon]
MAHSKERYLFRKKLKELSEMKGQGTELISIYITPGYNVSEVTNKLREEAGQAMNIKSKQTRKNVSAAIERLLHALKNMKKPPENGLAIFSGNIDDKVELFSIEPPEPLNIQTYRCDSQFFLDPLWDMLEAKEAYGLIIVDRREATLALLKGKRIELIKSMGSQVPGKHRAGGQSSVRFERLIEIAAHEWFKKVGDLANKNFEPEEVKGVILGGPGPTKHGFLNADYLSNKTKKKIVATVDTSYTDEFGIRELMQKSGDVMHDLEIIKEKKLLEKFLSEAALGGLAAYGEKEVREALTMGKVDTLLLSEELMWKRVEFKCPQCGAIKEMTVKEHMPLVKCDKDHMNMAPHVEKDFVEELAELAEQMASKIEMISTDTPEGEQFKEGFGGIGALLRFK